MMPASQSQVAFSAMWAWAWADEDYTVLRKSSTLLIVSMYIHTYRHDYEITASVPHYSDFKMGRRSLPWQSSPESVLQIGPDLL